MQEYVRQVVRELYGVELTALNQKHWHGPSRKSRSQSSSKSDRFTPPPSQPPQEEGMVCSHANLIPLLAALESPNAYYLVHPYLRFTLYCAITHSAAMFDDSVAKPLFVLFQLLRLLEHCHGLGLTLGELGTRDIFIDTRLWVQLRPLTSILGGGGVGGVARREEQPLSAAALESGGGGKDASQAKAKGDALEAGNKDGASKGGEVPSSNVITVPPSLFSNPDSQASLSSLTYSPPPSLVLSEATAKWRIGELTNFDYLMLLNHHAGRSIGDPNNHPMFPWVMDFTNRDSGFRDLSVSKYRLSKGDRQLEFTYLSAQEELKRIPDQDATVPHHIGDISSDVTYYVYLARRTPKEVLCSRVRPRWVPEEYPTSIEKMYIWSPDECIPEFYADPDIFRSIHADMSDLGLPTWSSSPEQFIEQHRSVLEGDSVSSQIHHWIDLMFGYKLSGDASVRAKNVYLSMVDKHTNPTNCGIVQLFRSPHPKRVLTTSAPLPLYEWTQYLNMSSAAKNVTSFSIDQLHSPRERSASMERRGLTTTPEPADSGKTLESILTQQSLKVSPQADQEDGAHADNDAAFDQLMDSFEQIDLPNDIKLSGGASQSGTANGGGDVGINYSDVAIAPQTPGATGEPGGGGGGGGPASKQRDTSVVVRSHSNRLRILPATIFSRQRKSNLGEPQESYDWQTAEISLPKDARILQELTRLEELSNFVSKSCKDAGSLFQNKWEPENFKSFKV